MTRRILALTATLLAISEIAVADDVVAFVDVNVISMTSETVLEHQTVIVRGGTIESIGSANSLSIPDDAHRIDGANKYLIPGLFDMHVHFRGGKERMPAMLKLFALTGVTTVLNMSGSAGILDLRDRIAKGEEFGPRIFTTSPILGEMSAHPKDYAAGVEVVERFQKEGYDFIKVYNKIPKEGYDGIMDTADRLRIPVIGHAVRSVGIDGAIERGQHIAHMEEFLYGYFNKTRDESLIAPLAQRMKDAGINVVATLIVYHNIIRQVNDLETMLKSDGIEYVPEAITKDWQADKNEYTNRFSKAEADHMEKSEFAFQQKVLRAFRDAGVPILAGTDAPIPIVVPGFSLHLELVELVETGLTPYEALTAATTAPAAFLSLANESGTIEPGKRADLLLLNGNPLTDITQTQHRAGVMLKGNWLDAPKIDEILEALKTTSTQ